MSNQIESAVSQMSSAYATQRNARAVEKRAKNARWNATNTVKALKGEAVQEIIESFEGGSFWDRSHSLLKSPDYKRDYESTPQEAEYIEACGVLDKAVKRATKAKRKLMDSYKGVERSKQNIQFELNMKKFS